MTRLVTGLALAAAVLAAILLLPSAALRVVVLAVALLATREYLGVVKRLQLPASAIPAYALVGIACWSTSFAAPRADLVVFAAMTVLLIEVLRHTRGLAGAAAAVAGGIYVGVPLGLLVATLQLAGREAVLLLIATVVVSDSAQYYTGRLFGKHPLAPAISPKKTIEGALGGLLFGPAVMVVGGRAVLPFASLTSLALAGVAVVILGICGDLFESRLKRAADMKDSSSLIPGHGGVLDRIDALLFASPVFYVFIQELM
jgi:phosphatidate cytidylyltransferase